MSALIVHPENHPRFGTSWRFPTVIAVDVDEELGQWVTLTIETERGEQLVGPGNPYAGDEQDKIQALATVGDELERRLHPEEARAIAAALWHQADQVDRRRAR